MITYIGSFLTLINVLVPLVDPAPSQKNYGSSIAMLSYLLYRFYLIYLKPMSFSMVDFAVSPPPTTSEITVIASPPTCCKHATHICKAHRHRVFTIVSSIVHMLQVGGSVHGQLLGAGRVHAQLPLPHVLQVNRWCFNVLTEGVEVLQGTIHAVRTKTMMRQGQCALRADVRCYKVGCALSFWMLQDGSGLLGRGPCVVVGSPPC